jgi:hypothetical protein
MEIIFSSKTLVPTYQTAQLHIAHTPDRDKILLLGVGHKAFLPVQRLPVLLQTKARQAQLHDKLVSINFLNSINPSLQNLEYKMPI